MRRSACRSPAAAANRGWRTVTISHMTFDLGGLDADGAPGPTLSIDATVDELVIDSSISAVSPRSACRVAAQFHRPHH